MPTHLGELDALQALVDTTVDRFGGIDIVVNNAANALTQPLGAVHARGVGQVVRREPARPRLPRPGGAAAPEGEPVRRGRSTCCRPARSSRRRTSPMYSAAKAGMHAFTRAMAREWAPLGIRVNALAPGTVDTDMVRNNPPEAQERMANAGADAARRRPRRDGRPCAAARVRRRELHHRRSRLAADGGLVMR